MLEACLDKCVVMIKDEKDRQVVMVILEGFAELADHAGMAMFARENRLDEVMAMLKLVIMEKVGSRNMMKCKYWQMYTKCGQCVGGTLVTGCLHRHHVRIRWKR